MNVTQWTPEAHALLVSMAAEGARVADIAKALGVTRNAVIGRARRKGVTLSFRVVARPKPPRIERVPRPPREPGERRRPKYLEAEIQRLRGLYAAGETYDAMERLTGIPRGSFGYLLRDEPRRRHFKYHRSYDHAFRVAAVSAVLTGESEEKAAKRLGFCKHSLRNWKARPDVLADATALANRIKADFAAHQEHERLVAEARAEAERIRVAAENAPLFAQMPERHRVICQRRIDGETFEAIGTDFGVTRERIRQVEARWRALGLIVPGAKPLSEATKNAPFVPKGRRRGRQPKARSADDFYAEAYAILAGEGSARKGKASRRPMKLSDAERQRRADWIRAVAHKRWEARA